MNHGPCCGMILLSTFPFNQVSPGCPTCPLERGSTRNIAVFYITRTMVFKNHELEQTVNRTEAIGKKETGKKLTNKHNFKIKIPFFAMTENYTFLKSIITLIIFSFSDKFLEAKLLYEPVCPTLTHSVTGVTIFLFWHIIKLPIKGGKIGHATQKSVKIALVRTIITLL